MTFKDKMRATAALMLRKRSQLDRILESAGLVAGEPTIVNIERIGTYDCAICGNTYGKDMFLDREAENMIHKANFGESLTEDAKSVCNECYETAKAKFNARINKKVE